MNGQNGNLLYELAPSGKHPLPCHQSDPVELILVVVVVAIDIDLMGLAFFVLNFLFYQLFALFYYL